MKHTYTIPDSPKMLKETLAVVQTWMGLSRREDRAVHIERLQRLIDECDRKRPIGSDGVHGDLHTAECGCDHIERRSRSMRKDADREVIDHEYTPRIEKLLLGRRVVAADERTDTLLLDDGTEIEVLGNEGCGGCSSGWYSVRSLAACDNVITKVEFDYDPSGDFDEDEDPGRYRIFVYAAHQKINLVDITGNDGNGYYGTGFQLVVRRPAGEGRR